MSAHSWLSVQEVRAADGFVGVFAFDAAVLNLAVSLAGVPACLPACRMCSIAAAAHAVMPVRPNRAAVAFLQLRTPCLVCSTRQSVMQVRPPLLPQCLRFSDISLADAWLHAHLPMHAGRCQHRTSANSMLRQQLCLCAQAGVRRLRCSTAPARLATWHATATTQQAPVGAPWPTVSTGCPPSLCRHPRLLLCPRT